MKISTFLFASAAALTLSLTVSAQAPQQINDSNTPLHLMKPEYRVPYGVPSNEEIKSDIDRVLTYIDGCTQPGKDAQGRLNQGTFRLTSYEWGVTYSAVLGAAKATGDKAYSDYAVERMKLIASVYPEAKKQYEKGQLRDGQMRSVVHPQALDDAGAVCCSMIKALIADPSLPLRPLIDNYIDYIMNGEYRLDDGTFARMRPLADAVWLDDMYMAIPAIAWYGRLTGDAKYTDEAVRQIFLFKEKMWVSEKGLFRHGWIKAMDPHPAFHWGRANGWALLTMTEVLDAIPEDHARRDDILDLYRTFAASLSSLQSSEGLWHQLLDRNDSYLETSATAIYTGCFAHAIAKGWLDPLCFGPVAVLGWNAVSTKINDLGQVEGTCVGTGMAFDPAFYYYRPTHVAAAHGYGPVIMAGGEMIGMLSGQHARSNDSAVQFYDRDYSQMGAIFSVTK